MFHLSLYISHLYPKVILIHLNYHIQFNYHLQNLFSYSHNYYNIPLNLNILSIHSTLNLLFLLTNLIYLYMLNISHHLILPILLFNHQINSLIQILAYYQYYIYKFLLIHLYNHNIIIINEDPI